MHSRLQRPLSELLRVAVVCSKNFGTVPDDPTGEMPDAGARCGRDCYRALASGWSVTAHRSRHRKGSLFAALAASLKCPSLMSAREAAPTSTPADVSSSFSQTLETRSGKLVRAKSFKAHHAASRDGRNPSTEYASRQQAPPICSPLTKQFQNIPTQTEIIRMRLRPLKPGVMPPPQRRHTITTNPVIATKHQQLKRRTLNRRPTMHGHLGRPPTQHADAPHTDGAAHATHPTQTQAPNPDAPSQTPCEPPPKVHTTATTPQPATHQDRTTATPAAAPQSTAAYDASPSPAPIRSPKLSKLPVRHMALPTPLSSPPGMPTASATTDFLVLIRKVQGSCEALQQQTMPPNFLKQRMNLGLASGAAHNKLRQRPNRTLQPVQLVACSAGFR